MLAILVNLIIVRNLAMFLVNWEIMVIMRNLSNFGNSGEPDGSADAYECGNSGSSVDSGNSGDYVILF